MTDRPAEPSITADAVAAPRTEGVEQIAPRHLYRAVVLFFLLAAALRYLPDLVYVALLLYAATVLAVGFNALVRLLPAKRAWVTAGIGLSLVAAIIAGFWFGTPLLVDQVRTLAAEAPAMQQQMQGWEQWLHDQLGLNVHLVGPRATQALSEALLGGGALSALGKVGGLLGTLLVPILVVISGLYAVAAPNDRLLEPVLRAAPRTTRPAVRRVLELLATRLLGWMKGTAISMLAVAVLSWLLFTLIGVPNALLLAVAAGLFEFIPLLGPWIAGAIAIAVAALIDPTKALWTGVAALVIQQVEGYVITPIAMSRAADVHPLVTIFALLLFGSMFGFLGILLALPLTFLVWTLVEVFWVERALDTDEDRIAPVVAE